MSKYPFFLSWVIVHCRYQSLSIRPSIDAYLGCFSLLAVMHNVAIKMGVQLSLEDSAFSFIGYSEVFLLDQVVIISLNFWWLTMLFSVVGAASYTPTARVHSFQFLHILVNICFLLCFVFIITTLMSVRWFHPFTSFQSISFYLKWVSCR